MDNPARKAAGKTVKAAEAGLAGAERALAQLLASALTAAQKNKAIPAAQDAITRAKQAVAAAQAARDAIPAKIAGTRRVPARSAPSSAPATAACRWCCGCWPPTPSCGSPGG